MANKKKSSKKAAGGKKQRSPAQKAAQRKAARAAHASRGGGGATRSRKKARRSGGGKKKHHRRRGGGGTTIARRNVASGASPAMSFKQFLIAALKIGGAATVGFVAGEALRRYLLQPKKDGTASMLAGFESRHGTSPAVSALITGLPGLAAGGGAYMLGRKFNSPGLRTVGGALAIGGVVSGGSRLLLGNQYVATKTGGLMLVQGASPGLPGNQLMAPSAPAPGTAAQQPGAGYGQYQQPPAWKQLGDAFVPNPYGDQYTGNPYGRAPMGDAFVGNPGDSYTTRVGDRPRAAAGFGLTAAEELGE